MFCTDSGGGSHGGSPFARIAVMTAGPDARLVCRNTADLGTRNGPLVEGQHLFLRSDKAFTCIAVTTPEGRQFQEKRIAGFQSKTPPRPADAGAVAVAPVKFDSLPMGSPIVPLVNERAPVCWLEAGPFPADTSLDDTAAAALHPSDGTELKIGQSVQRFRSLTGDEAWNDPPRYKRHYSLQGTGDIIPTFASWINPAPLSATNKVGVFCTV